MSKNENKDKEDKRKMATQLAPTPTYYGEDAKKILASAKKKPSELSKKNGQKLVEYFSRIEKRKG
jgi:hypothetical protein